MLTFPFLFWLRMGLLSWGGPSAQIAMLEQECVTKRGWLTLDEFTRALGLCMFLPGPEAQQLVAWTAWRRHGWPGAAMASLLFVLPGLILCGLFAWLYVHGSQWSSAPGVLAGARAAVAGVVIVAGCKLLWRTCAELPRRWAAGLSLAGLWLGAPFLAIAVSAGLFGWYIRPEDEGELAPVADPLRQAIRRVGVSLLPLVGGYLVLWVIFGHAHGYVQLVEVSLFAVLTSFGGAYAALGIWRVRADGLRWLKTENFGDALVMGEATPGPLLLAGSFVGFLAGYQAHLFADGGVFMGIVGLVTVAIFTFIPSTLLILGFAPLAEEGVGDRRFHDVLGMVSAVAAGAILYLGLTVALSVFFSPGLMVVTLAASFLFYKQKVSVPVLVAGGAGIGLLLVR